MPGFRKSQAALGGETCTVPAVGSGAGASAQCTSTENGFCLIDQLTVTGANPVTGVNTAGKCVCYYGYSGPKCATKTSTTSSKSNSGTLLSAAALSALAAPVPEAYPVPGAVCPDAGWERRYAATPPMAIATTEFENPSVLAAVFETPPVLVLGTDGSAATKA
uniref:EGF-like domain-containing protein n=1 Tax=Magallana gigas TaxID=29159 RepID=A0A8W8ILV7_MAGGI